MLLTRVEQPGKKSGRDTDELKAMFDQLRSGTLSLIAFFERLMRYMEQRKN